jgi:hypothetical protein
MAPTADQRKAFWRAVVSNVPGNVVFGVYCGALGYVGVWLSPFDDQVGSFWGHVAVFAAVVAAITLLLFALPLMIAISARFSKHFDWAYFSRMNDKQQREYIQSFDAEDEK